MRSASAELGWFTECSEAGLRSVLRTAAPELADLAMSLKGRHEFSSPLTAFSTAMLGGRVFAKFAFSAPTAVRIWREAQALELLGGELGLPVPKLVAAQCDPTFLATELVGGGSPLAYATVSAAIPDRIEPFARELARFLSELHAARTLALVRERIHDLPRVPRPGLHISSDDGRG